MHARLDRRERNCAAWVRDGSELPDQADRCAGRGKLRLRRSGPPEFHSWSDAQAPCPAGAEPPTPAAPRKRSGEAGRPILPVSLARKLGREPGLLVRFLPLLDEGKHLFRMAFGRNLGKNVQQRLIRANYKRGPFNPHTFFPYMFFSFITPNRLQTFSSTSARSVYGRSYLARNLAWALGVSREMPSTTAPAACSFLKVSRKPQASIVQPGVSALG